MNSPVIAFFCVEIEEKIFQVLSILFLKIFKFATKFSFRFEFFPQKQICSTWICHFYSEIDKFNTLLPFPSRQFCLVSHLTPALWLQLVHQHSQAKNADFTWNKSSKNNQARNLFLPALHCKEVDVQIFSLLKLVGKDQKAALLSWSHCQAWLLMAFVLDVEYPHLEIKQKKMSFLLVFYKHSLSFVFYNSIIFSNVCFLSCYWPS